jgi:hypothetical protein
VKCAVVGALVAVTLLSAGRARADEPVQEITVHGAKKPAPGSTTVAREEVRQLPGAFGDAFRAIESLPGATPMVNGVPYFLVRGAPPGNTGYFLDGVGVPLLYHVAFGPAVVHPALIDRVDFHPGGLPARFGRVVGGVVSAETVTPSERPRLEAHARLFDAGAFAESPLLGGKADALVAGRYSYTGAALSLLSPGVELGYWDYQARANLSLTPSDRIGVFAFGSHDRRSAIGDIESTFEADFHRIDVRYDRALGGGGKARVAVTVGVDRSANELGEAQDRLVRTRAELEQRLAPTVLFRAGADAQYTHYDAGTAKNRAIGVILALRYPEHAELTTGTYADVVWRPIRDVEITPGARLDLYESRRFPPAGFGRSRLFGSRTFAVPTVDPRLAVRVAIHPRVALVSTVAALHQGPSFVAPTPGVQPAAFQDGLQSSIQRSAGVETKLPLAITATATVFSHAYRNMMDFSSCSFEDAQIDIASPCITERHAVNTTGLEVFARRALTQRLGGMITYTLSRSERTLRYFDEGRRPAFGGFRTPLDQTHVLHLVGTYDLGRGWRAGARFVYTSGRPYYPRMPFSPEHVTLDPFHRIDVRLEKRWRLSEHASVSAVLEGFNVTMQREASYVVCPEEAGRQCEPVSVPALTIPSIGVELSL